MAAELHLRIKLGFVYLHKTASGCESQFIGSCVNVSHLLREVSVVILYLSWGGESLETISSTSS